MTRVTPGYNPNPLRTPSPVFSPSKAGSPAQTPQYYLKCAGPSAQGPEFLDLGRKDRLPQHSGWQQSHLPQNLVTEGTQPAQHLPTG